MADWRRTLYTIWFTQFFALAGFNFVVPFLPYYIQDLGVTDVGQVAMWSGLCSAAVSIGLAIMAPIWGDIADRRGRKLMVLRATFGGAIAMTLMGFVMSVQQLLALRLLQGALTGTITASTTLVASIVPADRRGSALGSLQTAIFLGTTLGPLLGGVVGEAFGYRQSFWITGALLVISGVGVALFVHENYNPGAARGRGQKRGYGQALSFLFASGGVLTAVFAARILLRAGTVVPNATLALFIQSLLPSSGHAALITGLTSGVSAVGGALGAPIIGGWSDRWGHKRLLIASALAAAVFYTPQAFAPNAAWLIACQLASGFAVGGILSSAMALLAEYTTAGHEGVIFGLDASATGLATAVGPMLGATVAASFSLRAPFLVAAAVLVAGALVVILRVRPAEAWDELPSPPAPLPMLGEGR